MDCEDSGLTVGLKPGVTGLHVPPVTLEGWNPACIKQRWSLNEGFSRKSLGNGHVGNAGPLRPHGLFRIGMISVWIGCPVTSISLSET